MPTAPPDPAERMERRRGRLGSARLGLALVYDVVPLTQNAESESQVGPLGTLGRIPFPIVSGGFGRSRRAIYLVSADYDPLEAVGHVAFTLNDLAVTIPIAHFGEIAIGRQKEGVTQQILDASRGIPFTERAAPVLAFVPTRNDGLRVSGFSPRWRVGWLAGAFNDGLFDKYSALPAVTQADARAFAAPVTSADSSSFFQIGLNARWTNDRDGTLRFRAKPEVNSVPDFVDTGELPATGAMTGGLEMVAQHRGVSIAAEALDTHVSDHSAPTTRLVSYYAELSWRPGNEVRTYEAARGVLGRVQLVHRTAWEFATRFSHVDLDDRAAQGGVLNEPSVALSWYAPTNIRAELDYAYAFLHRDGGTGRTQLVTLRLQWELR